MKRKNFREGSPVALLVLLGLLGVVLFGDVGLGNGLTNFSSAAAYHGSWEEVFAALGQSLEGESDFAAVFAPTEAAVLVPPAPASTVTPTPMPTPTPTLTPSPSPTPTPTPTPSPTSRPYDGPALPAGATMEYQDLELENTASPAEGAYTSNFGWRVHPLTGQMTFHKGVDLSAAEGSEVYAFADGVVLAAGWEDSYGNYIKLQHSDRVVTLYAHCSQLLKSVGDSVRAGEVIAKSGSTGNVTGPHLHFEVRVEQVLCDPAYYLESP